MTRQYCTDGTPIDILKREAKRQTKERQSKLSTIQNELAKERGYKNWAALVARTIEIDEDFGWDGYDLTMRRGPDTVIFSLDGIVSPAYDPKDPDELGISKSVTHVAYSTEVGHRFHAIVGTHSTAWWAAIPREGGQLV